MSPVVSPVEGTSPAPALPHIRTQRPLIRWRAQHPLGARMIGAVDMNSLPALKETDMNARNTAAATHMVPGITFLLGSLTIAVLCVYAVTL